MKYSAMALALGLALAGTMQPVHAGTQVVAGNGMTLTDAARIKFNRDTRGDDQQAKVVPGRPASDYSRLAASFGMGPELAKTMSLEQVFVAKINHGEGAADRQIERNGVVGMASRSPYGSANRAQLAASAGLHASEATRMSLGEIAAAKFDRDGTLDN